MPTYSYYCGRCDQRFELFFNISSYESNPQCIHCKSSKTERDYETDLISICPSVKKADSENTGRLGNEKH
jgi:putative FmdB family regulatory protein